MYVACSRIGRYGAQVVVAHPSLHVYELSVDLLSDYYEN